MYWISLSGGLGSAITTLVAWERDVEFGMVFADTLIEDEDLYRFVLDVAFQVRGDRPSSGHTILTAMARNIPVLTPDDPTVMCRRTKYLRMLAAMANAVIPGFRWLIDGRTPWDVYVDKKWIGNTRTAHCSTALKTDHVKAYIEAHGAEDDPLVLGMDWSEMDRIERAQKRWEPRPVVSLLNEFKVDRPEYDLILNRYGIRKPRLYGEGFSHNNCGGYCCKAGLKQFANLRDKEPERYEFHAQEMERVLEEIGPTAKPFLRKTLDGELEYITLKQYERLLDTGSIDVPEFDAEGCGCFTDE